jgi:hypothetical protein
MILRWIQRLVGFETTASDDETTDFSQFTLYEIGDRLCRHYWDGITDNVWPATNNATHFGEESMRTVLQDAYSDAELTTGMIRDLDRLTEHAEDTKMQAKASGGIDPDKVQLFREVFFEQFNRHVIAGVLRDLYAEIRDEQFALDECFQTEQIDAFEYRWDVRADTYSNISFGAEAPSQIEAQSFHTKSIEMRKLCGRLNIAESHCTDVLTEMIRGEAELCWDKMDIDGANTVYETQDECLEAVFQSMDDVREAGGRPDICITNGDMPQYEPLWDTDHDTDSTGVMDTAFVVADSGSCGKRVVRQPLTIEQQGLIDDEKYIYDIKWAGNYAVTQPDMLCGP